jgi:hypothetical protein
MSKSAKALQKLEKPRKEKDPYAWQLPTRVGFYGSSGSGKSYKLIEYLCEYGKHQFDQVLWVAPPGSLVQKKLQLIKKCFGQFLHVVEGLNTGKIEELIKVGESADPPWQTCVVFDDLMLQTDKNSYVTSLWISGRHRSVTVVEQAQQIFHGKRTGRLQMEYFYLFRMGLQRDETKRLFQQLTTNVRDRELLMLAYRRITERPGPGGCLILDTKSPASEGLRVRDTDENMVIPQLANI